MNISKSSWLYKLHRRFNSGVYRDLDGRGTITLCQYFWASLFLVIYSSIVFISMTIAVLLAANAVVALLLVVVFNVIIPISVEFAVIALVIFGIVSFAIMFCKMINKLVDDEPLFPEYMSKYLPKKEVKVNKKPVEYKPSILAEYYKAYKSKFCPIITLKGE